MLLQLQAGTEVSAIKKITKAAYSHQANIWSAAPVDNRDLKYLFISARCKATAN
jgi:hypothetical protein